jgi:hypothetical protein
MKYQGVNAAEDVLGLTHTNHAGRVWCDKDVLNPLAGDGTSKECAPHRANPSRIPQYVEDTSEKELVASTAKSFTPHTPLGRRMYGPLPSPTVVVEPVSKFTMLVGFCRK